MEEENVDGMMSFRVSRRVEKGFAVVDVFLTAKADSPAGQQDKILICWVIKAKS